MIEVQYYETATFCLLTALLEFIAENSIHCILNFLLRGDEAALDHLLLSAAAAVDEGVKGLRLRTYIDRCGATTSADAAPSASPSSFRQKTPTTEAFVCFMK